MQYSDTTNRTGIVELLENLTETQSASSGSYPLAIKNRDINLAFDDYQNFVKKVAGTWQADDANHVKYPNMKFNVRSGQQDYNFTEDEQGNQIQDIYRVEIMGPDGVWRLLYPYDEMAESDSIGQRETLSGIPTRYYKTANGIFLDVTPNYDATQGIRMWYTRSPSYFTVTDTTKEPGIPNGHHRYLALKPAFWFWLPKDAQRASLYKAELKEIEDSISQEFADRKRDETLVITAERVCSV